MVWLVYGDRNRKESVTITLSEPQRFLISEVLRLESRGMGRMYLVGGMLRDLLLTAGSADADFDFVVEGSASECAEQLAQALGASHKSFDKFHTAKVYAIKDCGTLTEVDFVSTRSECYPRPGSLPLVQPGTLEQDIRRRDFTINALAVPLVRFNELVRTGAFPAHALRTEIIDLVAGLKDLDTRQIRTLHAKSFSDDPTRLFRALRYMVRMQGSLAQETAVEFSAAVRSRALHSISATRILNELRKYAQEAQPQQLFSALESHQLLHARPLYNSERALQIEVSLQRLPRVLGLTAEQKFELLLLQFYRSFEVNEARKVFSEWKFGKAQLQKFERIMLPDSQEATTLNELSLAAHFLNHPDNPHYENELQRRGMLVQ